MDAADIKVKPLKTSLLALALASFVLVSVTCNEACAVELSIQKSRPDKTIEHKGFKDHGNYNLNERESPRF